MITECWTPQSNHRDTFFSIYLVSSVKRIKTPLRNRLLSTTLVQTTMDGPDLNDFDPIPVAGVKGETSNYSFK